MTFGNTLRLGYAYDEQVCTKCHQTVSKGTSVYTVAPLNGNRGIRGEMKGQPSERERQKA